MFDQFVVGVDGCVGALDVASKFMQPMCMDKYVLSHACVVFSLHQAVQAAQTEAQRFKMRTQKQMQAKQRHARDRAQKLALKNGQTARQEALRKAQVRAWASWVLE